jgi:hypothetical protein
MCPVHSVNYVTGLYPFISLSHWERVGVRAYGRVYPFVSLVVEYHSPTTTHRSENRFLSQALIPGPSPRGRREKTQDKSAQSIVVELA